MKECLSLHLSSLRGNFDLIFGRKKKKIMGINQKLNTIQLIEKTHSLKRVHARRYAGMDDWSKL